MVRLNGLDLLVIVSVVLIAWGGYRLWCWQQQEQAEWEHRERVRRARELVDAFDGSDGWVDEWQEFVDSLPILLPVPPLDEDAA